MAVRSETVENLYQYYREEKLLVNRRYQRKLVWTIEEKEKFIESILNNYPVPLILVAEVNYQGQDVFEIIDGMQRLNALSAFIEGEFTLHGKYFDLESIVETKYLLDNKLLKQKTPKLSREDCKEIASYAMPLSVYRENAEGIIDEVFKRINSNGKHLSQQELRQAGSQTSFARLVRRLSENIRGDVSHSDRLTLNNMKNISINSRDLNYGINMGGIFWRKHNLITSDNIRDSRDEEMIANLLSGILIKPRPSATSQNLDSFYQGNMVLEDTIKKLGEDFIVTQFEAVFNEIRQTFESTRKSFYHVLFHKKSDHVNRTFQVFFFAFYELLVVEQKKIINHSALCNALEGRGDDFFTANAADFINSSKREDAVRAACGLMKDYFIPRNSNDPVLDNGVMKLEGLLERSYTEQTCYDFKIGFYRMDKSGQFDQTAFDKVMKTLVAIANMSKGSMGYVVIGVANKKADSDRYEELYHSPSRRFRDYFIAGTQGEASNCKSHDEYRSMLENKIRTSNITPSSYKDYILRNIDYFNYYDKSILILKIENDGRNVAKFDGQCYERHGTSTVLVPNENEADIWKRILS